MITHSSSPHHVLLILFLYIIPNSPNPLTTSLSTLLNHSS
jgi:hypothetical protein